MESFVTGHVVGHDLALLRGLIQAAFEVAEDGVRRVQCRRDLSERQRRIVDAEQVDVAGQYQRRIHRFASSSLSVWGACEAARTSAACSAAASAAIDGERNPPAAELAGERRFGNCGHFAIGRDLVGVDLMPVAHDQRGVARRAKGGAALGVVDVAGVDVMQAGFERDLARARASVAGGVGGRSVIL